MRSILAGLIVFTALFASSQADTLPPAGDAPKVHVQLIADRDAVRPGGTVTVAVEQDIAAGWHTYWSNPGEAGQPTEVKWTLPPGWKAGAIQWPYPVRLPVGPLMDYGYEGKVWQLVDLTVPADAAAGTVRLEALVQYLVCREVCIPEEGKAGVSVVVDPAAGGPASSSAGDFAAARAKIPAVSPWPVRYALGKDLRLFVEAPALAGTARPVTVQFFPAESGSVVDAAPQTFGFAKNGLVVELKPGEAMAGRKALSGVLVMTSSDTSVQALAVRAVAGVVPAAATTGQEFSLWLALTFAALGGLILNIMPCVLPVLAMKALALAGHAGADRAHARAESFSYALGAILSFVAFGLLVMGLRTGGAAIGWGFQLQEPVVVAGLALLMVAVGLNMSGVFEIAPISAGDALARRGGLLGAFFTGVLAVAVAAPCTAPFMATAIGYGFTQESSLVVIGIFTALGVGFALPFILLGLMPAMHKLLPKPGAWMVRLKHLLALPMYAAAGWLVWVLAQQVDRMGLGAALAAVFALAIALWLWGAMQRRGHRPVFLTAIVAVLAGAGYALSVVASASPPAPVTVASHAGMASEPYTPARLAALRQEGRPVFIDATASWCITCLVNEEAALSRPAVHNAFKDRKIALLVADWTNKNPEITALLQQHGRSGVPLYLYYAPGSADAKILPQILTEGEVLKALNG